MVESKIPGYHYTGEVFNKRDDDELFGTALDNVSWLYRDGEVHLVTTHAGMNVLLGIYAPSGHTKLGTTIKKVKADRLKRQMLLPDEYMVVGDIAYVVERRTPSPGKSKHVGDSDDGNDTMDIGVKASTGVRETILRGMFNEVVEGARNALQSVSHATYRALYMLRDVYDVEWNNEYQRELRRWALLSTGEFYTGEEAGLLAIHMVEETCDAINRKGSKQEKKEENG